MKQLLLALSISSILIVGCKKDDNNNNNNNNLNLGSVIAGNWELTGVKQIEDGSIQGFPYYRDYITDTIFASSTMVVDDGAMSLDIRYGYSARDIGTNPPTPYTTGGYIDIEGSYEVAGSNLYIYDGSDTINYTATTVERNKLVLRHIENINEPGIEQIATITERFTWTRAE